MKREGGSEAAKRRAGERAAEAVSEGDVVGLGTGSTAAHAIRALGRRRADGLDVRGIPTSHQSRELAIEVGIPLTALDEVGGVDVAIDGADQLATVDRSAGADGGETATSDRGEPTAALIKGGGAAHAREKVVDAAADRFLVVVDPSKLAATLDRPIPVEVLPDAVPVVEDALRGLGGEPALRAAEGKDGPVVTDNGNLVVDSAFGPVDDPAGLAAALSAIPGILEHGLFVGMADVVCVGHEDGVDVRRYRTSEG